MIIGVFIIGHNPHTEFCAFRGLSDRIIESSEHRDGLFLPSVVFGYFIMIAQTRIVNMDFHPLAGIKMTAVTLEEIARIAASDNLGHCDSFSQ
jgi:hypothetical protein